MNEKLFLLNPCNTFFSDAYRRSGILTTCLEESAETAYELHTGFIGVGEFLESHETIRTIDRVIGCTVVS